MIKKEEKQPIFVGFIAITKKKKKKKEKEKEIFHNKMRLIN